MYQAIRTHYLGATNTLPARIKASAPAGYLTVKWNHSLNIDDNHRHAAEKFAEVKGWVGERYGALAGGALKDGDFVWVFHNDFAR